MRKVRLFEIAELNPENLSAGTPADYRFVYLDLSAVKRGVINWAGSKVMTFGSSPSRARRCVREGDCLLGTVRPRQQSHAYVARSEIDTVASTGFVVLRAKKDVADPRFLYHTILSNGVLRQTDSLAVGSNYPAVNEADVANLLIDLPGLEEQRRIAEILDAIDAQIAGGFPILEKQRSLREGALRFEVREGLRLIESVEVSRLNEIAGRTSEGWSSVRLGDLLTRIEVGHSPDLEERPAGPDEWGVLKVSAVGRNGFRPKENKVACERSLQQRDLCVNPGDLIMTRANTSDLVGLSCIVKETPPNLMLSDKTLRLIVNSNKVPPAFVDLVLSMRELRTQIQIAATGTSASMKNISQSSIRNLIIPFADFAQLERICALDVAYGELMDTQRQELLALRSVRNGLAEDLLTGAGAGLSASGGH